ncbi:hypothetical protein TNCT_613521 [Trichonephila clavata]|uniref:Uncharacterized protein n=1 Tax=Trichonephila clavata TaxID=2740835 RepID=A0A8X6KX00_TRICU|nr:hypothetical protein TNCT_613521 [Trichonephila clavata]
MDADRQDLKDEESKGEKELLHKTEMNHYKQDLQDIIGLGDVYRFKKYSRRKKPVEKITGGKKRKNKQTRNFLLQVIKVMQLDPGRDNKGVEGASLTPGISGVPLLGDPPGIYVTPAAQYRVWNTGYDSSYSGE